jgi:hypothetical protein
MGRGGKFKERHGNKTISTVLRQLRDYVTYRSSFTALSERPATRDVGQHWNHVPCHALHEI